MTREQWMRHGLQVARGLADKSAFYVDHRLMTPQEQGAILREVAIRERVLVAQRGRERLRGEERIWQVYMYLHARLQQRRYGGKLPETSFHIEAQKLRRWRDEQIEGLRGWRAA